eukprot:1160166-Pelagomonas_calceolata.AAC.10
MIRAEHPFMACSSAGGHVPFKAAHISGTKENTKDERCARAWQWRNLAGLAPRRARCLPAKV